MRYVTDERSRREYTEFLSRHERCNFQQSVEWAAVKSNWKNEIVLAEDGQGRITGGMSILIRKIPFFGNLMYCARGPVCDTHDQSSLRQLIEGAELLAWKYDAMALRMEPDVSAGDGDFRAIVESLGCKVRDGSRHARDVIQPRSVFRLDIRGKSEAELMAGFSAKLRYNIRLAQRRGVSVREGTREDLPAFYELMRETARRDRFLARPLEYFQRIWDEMGPEHMTLLLAYFQDEPIAGAISIFYGDKTWYAYGASSDRHRSVMPNYLLQWEMIRRAAARGDGVYDLRGVLRRGSGPVHRGGVRPLQTGGLRGVPAGGAALYAPAGQGASHGRPGRAGPAGDGAPSPALGYAGAVFLPGRVSAFSAQKVDFLPERSYNITVFRAKGAFIHGS